MAPLISFGSVLLGVLYFLAHFVTAVPPIISGEPDRLLNDDVVKTTCSPPSNSSKTATFQRAKLLRRVAKNGVPDDVGTHSNICPGSASFPWASIGDSWSSGVSYDGANTDYDNNTFGCLRIKTAYEAQMEADNRWTVLPQDLNFASCSGAVMCNMALCDAAPGHPGPQINDIGTPTVLTMQVGGNNLDFGHLVEACFVQPNPFIEYPAYPDPSGDCGKSFADKKKQILDRTTKDGFYYNYKATLQDVLKYPSMQFLIPQAYQFMRLMFPAAIAKNPNFRLYVLGYAHFFNADTDWCDTVSFRYIPTPRARQQLTKQIRADFNNAMDLLFQVYRDVITDIGDTRVKFLDINPAFEGHRFCEPGHTIKQQWYHNDVWLWNLNQVYNDPDKNPTAQTQSLELDSGKDAQGNPIVINANITDLDSSDEVHARILETWQMRTFHPKSAGHQAVKRAIIAQMRADDIDGVKPLVAPSTAPFSPGTCHLSIRQWLTCNDNADLNQFLGNVQITDNAGTQIGSLDAKFQSGDVHPVIVGSKIDTLLSISIDNQQNLQFDLQDRLTWNSSDSNYCSTGLGWIPDDITCEKPPSDRMSRIVTCNFPCTWNGGIPTDSYW
ncbi:SGNH hydrolase [Stipitochalara longipes BDJ]|nr:SGNH hydrolase [Stipitochalara longipes BDJ]